MVWLAARTGQLARSFRAGCTDILSTNAPLGDAPLAGRGFLKVPDGPVYIRLFRLNGAIQGMFGPDGKRWVLLKKLAVPYPDKVKIGLSASNVSKEALTARFQEFVLLTDRKEVSEADRP